MIDGKKVGDGTVSENGTLSVLLTDKAVTDLMGRGEIQHLSIDPTFKK